MLALTKAQNHLLSCVMEEKILFGKQNLYENVRIFRRSRERCKYCKAKSFICFDFKIIKQIIRELIEI